MLLHALNSISNMGCQYSKYAFDRDYREYTDHSFDIHWMLKYFNPTIVSLVHEGKKPTAKCHVEKVYQHHFC